MRLEHYEIDSGRTSYTFEFISIGDKGAFKKVASFERNGTTNLYNLAFGDKNELTNEFDDSVVTDNGDTIKVLATISAIVSSFTDNYPDAVIYFRGSTPSRTRLYKMGISKYFEVLTNDYEIYGETTSGWEIFRKNHQYIAFLVKRKTT